MTEPIEKITDETVIGSTWQFNDTHEVRFKNLEEPYCTMLLTSQAKDAKIKELEKLRAFKEWFDNEKNSDVYWSTGFDDGREAPKKEVTRLTEKLKVAMRLLDKSQPATSGDGAGDQRDAGDWWLALKKLKAK